MTVTITTQRYFMNIKKRLLFWGSVAFLASASGYLVAEAMSADMTPTATYEGVRVIYVPHDMTVEKMEALSYECQCMVLRELV